SAVVVRGVGLTNEEGACAVLKRDEGVREVGRGARAADAAVAAPVELNLGEAAQGAPLGGGASVEGRCETCELVEVVAVAESASVDVAVAHFVTDITTNLQAGLGARDVE